MGKIERFEDLRSWQKARQLANAVYDLTNRHEFNKDFRLCSQVRNAAGSVMHNIAEGFDAGSDAEFTRFLKFARRSASEVQSQLYLSLDRQYITREELNRTYEMATETKRLINGLISYLRKSKSSGKAISDIPADYRTNDYRTIRPSD
jgi:four helix bundle protein